MLTQFLGRVFHFASSQLRAVPEPKGRFDAKTVVVTGANVGLGLEAARHFYRLGADKVILACRNTDKGEAAKADIASSCPGASGTIEVWSLDLTSFESVKAFARRAEEQLDRLDVLMENAGIATYKANMAEGYEATITTNVISTALLALLLLPKLKRTAAQFNTVPHLTIVSSDAHVYAPFKERNLPKIFDNYKTKDTMHVSRYNDSKLLDVWMAREMARRLDESSVAGSPVVVNSLNPGLCRSEIFRDVPFPLTLILELSMLMFGRTSEAGSRILVAAACGGHETHGKYIDSCVVYQESALVRSEEGDRLQKKVFAELLDILEGIEPGLDKVL